MIGATQGAVVALRGRSPQEALDKRRLRGGAVFRDLRERQALDLLDASDDLRVLQEGIGLVDGQELLALLAVGQALVDLCQELGEIRALEEGLDLLKGAGRGETVLADHDAPTFSDEENLEAGAVPPGELGHGESGPDGFVLLGHENLPCLPLYQSLLLSSVIDEPECSKWIH